MEVNPRAALTSVTDATSAVRWRGTVDVGGVRYVRAVVRTQWIEAGDDLGGILVRELGPLLDDGDLVIISEKAATIAEGLAVPACNVPAGSLATRLAGWVRPTESSRGLSIPEKMEYVLREAGRSRILFATATAALTRPLGVRGGFYMIAGRVARAMDGMRPPFEHVLIPPLTPRVASALARSLADRLGWPVAIVDMNDRGGSIRSISHRVMSARRLRRVLLDNPLGQRDERTPIGLVRRVSPLAVASPARNPIDQFPHEVEQRV